MNKEKLLAIPANFKNKRILVVGDIMLDKYIWGDVSRISPEAPVQVVNIIRETYAPGGAANVANNVAALGAEVYLVGIAGEDESRRILLSELNKRDINTDGVYIDGSKPTIQKIRAMARSQQLLRIDYESKNMSTDLSEKSIIDFISLNIEKFDGVIVSDYAKGVITPQTMSRLRLLSKDKNKPIIVDPKPKNCNLYANVTLVTPNHNEASEMANIEVSDEASIREIGLRLVNSLSTNILVTRGEKGMSLFEADREITDIPTKAKEVYNIIGAGDTVVAVVALALVSGATLKEAAILGNIAAGIKVGKIEDPTVATREIEDYLKNNFY